MSAYIAEWQAQGRNLYIRDIVTMEDYREVEKIQIQAWGFNELDVVPSGQLIAAKWAGAVLLGAFDAEQMIGFVYGFPALEAGHVSLHSHMLAVRPESRNLHAGIFLKLAQRIKVLEQGLDEISWTFDPLQVLNANLNFARLGVISHRYIVNFYGEETSSPLHRGLGTDRLWVRWLISSDRVKHRVAIVSPTEFGNTEEPPVRQVPDRQVPERHPFAALPVDSATPLPDTAPQLPATAPQLPATAPQPLETAPQCPDIALHLAEAGPLVLVRSRNSWQTLVEPGHRPESDECLIEIPVDIGALKRTDIELAHHWRSVVQSAFIEFFSSGFVAREFVRVGSPSDARWFYFLTRNRQKG